MSSLPRLPRWTRCLAIALLAVGLAALTARLSFFRVMESKTVDYRFRTLADHPTASRDIVIVEIDDASIKMLEPQVGRWPWPRDVHAVLLDFMRQAGARLVVFDVTFLERDIDHPERDEELGRATARSGNVVHDLFLGEQETARPDQRDIETRSIPGCKPFPSFVEIELPIVPVRSTARALGHVAMALDPDGPWRRSLPLACYGGRLYPSLPVAAALALQNLEPKDIRWSPRELRFGSIRAPLDSDSRLPIWFNGPPGSYSRVSFGKIFYSALELEEGKKPLVSPDQFKGKIVFVGASAAALFDLFTTPYSGGAGARDASAKAAKTVGKMAGTEVQANILDSLLHGRFLRDVPFWLVAAVVSLVSVLAAASVFYLPLWGALLGLVLTPTVYLAVAQFAFARHYRLPVVPVVLAWAFAETSGFVYQYWIEDSEKRKIRKIFSHYVSRDVLHELLSNPSAAALGGKRAEATVLFSDLRGFTTLSEKTPPEALINQLNEYFAAMVEIVFEHRGTVDKFVGDMIMALFNVPLPDPEHAANAVRCAVAMQRRLVELNTRWRVEGRPEFRSGVGVNTGEMIVGNVGSESIRSYTVIGDSVNLGSRLESLCKERDAQIIVSEYTRNLLPGDQRLRDIGEVTVKGKSQPVRVYAVDWRPADSASEE
jgi:adenylate cyclase